MANGQVVIVQCLAAPDSSMQRGHYHRAVGYFFVMFHITGTGPASQPEMRSLR